MTLPVPEMPPLKVMRSVFDPPLRVTSRWSVMAPENSGLAGVPLAPRVTVPLPLEETVIARPIVTLPSRIEVAEEPVEASPMVTVPDEPRPEALVTTRVPWERVVPPP